MGDSAVSIVLGDEITPEINEQVHKIGGAIVSKNLSAVSEVLSTYSGLVVHYDPLKMTLDEFKDVLTTLCQNNLQSLQGESRVVNIPTLYGGEYGPDLNDVSNILDISESEIIRLHASNKYLVYGLGFSPGFPYLGGLSSQLYCERLSTPRLEVPSGSVAIAESQTGIYPVSSPGGWRLIGRTPVKMFDSNKSRPSLVEPGDFIQFRPISVSEFNEISGLIDND
jgi:inhibitor of KinA